MLKFIYAGIFNTYDTITKYFGTIIVCISVYHAWYNAITKKFEIYHKITIYTEFVIYHWRNIFINYNTIYIEFSYHTKYNNDKKHKISI